MRQDTIIENEPPDFDGHDGISNMTTAAANSTSQGSCHGGAIPKSMTLFF